MLGSRNFGIVRIGILAVFFWLTPTIWNRQFTAAVDPATVSKSVKPLTVLIETEGENGSGVLISQGSGRYKVLTAAHVLADRIKCHQ